MSFEEIECIEGGMACWLATTLFLASGFVGAVACVETGGLACAGAVVACADLYWQYLDSCYPGQYGE